MRVKLVAVLAAVCWPVCRGRYYMHAQRACKGIDSPKRRTRLARGKSSQQVEDKMSKKEEKPDNNTTAEAKKKVIRKKDPNKDYSYIKRALVYFTGYEPFYGRLLSRFSIDEDFEQPTAYVRFNYELFKESGMISYKLGYNPEFFDVEVCGKYKNELGQFEASESTPGYREIAFILAHEIFHVILGHLGDRNILAESNDERQQVNIAMDLAINSLINESMKTENKYSPAPPDMVFLPGVAAKTQNIEFNEMIAGLEKLQTTGFYYRKIREFIEEQQEENGEGGEQAIKILLGDQEGIDSHDDWDTLPQELKEQLKSHMKNKMKEAANHCRKSNNWGSASSHVQEIINTMIAESPVDWRNLLETAIGQSRMQENDSSYKKLSKKLPMLMPGVLRKFTQPIAIFIDQSGSMSNEAVQLAFAQATNCAKHVEIDVFNFDTEVDESSHEIWKQGKTQKTWKRTRDGGTDFNAIKKYIESDGRRVRRQWRWIVIVTDGYAPSLDPMKPKVLWLITPDGQKPENVRPQDLVGMMKYPNSDTNTFS